MLVGLRERANVFEGMFWVGDMLTSVHPQRGMAHVRQPLFLPSEGGRVFFLPSEDSHFVLPFESGGLRSVRGWSLLLLSEGGGLRSF